MTKRISTLVVLLILAVAVIGCGGSPSNPTPGPKGQPLDPQGNWLFQFGGGSTNLSLAGQLYELNPPTVTSNPFGVAPGSNSCPGSITFSGQASGTNSITLTAVQTGNGITQAITVALTGTIAADQAHMSGTWTLSQGVGCVSNTSGTWTAQLLTPVTGSWTGTVSSGSTNITVTASLTEVTDQTVPNMGQVTGTVTLNGAPCFANDAFTIGSSGPNTATHGGELLIINASDASNVGIAVAGSVSPDGHTDTITSFQIHGGVCDGMNLSGTASH